MFRFANPEMFWLMLAIPLLIAASIFFCGRDRRRLQKFGDLSTVGKLIPERSPNRRRIKTAIMITAVFFLIVALARPQTGARFREEHRAGIEIIFAVDVSNSMLARDLEPSRLERTKAALFRSLAGLGQDRIGLIVFAGDAYVQLPVTSDFTTARSFISNLSTTMVSRQGTAIGAAIDLATNSFSSASEGSRALILISDGENHEDDALNAAQRAADKGITIYTIGIGTPEGAPIEIGNDFIRDENGNMVVTKLNEAMLEELALTTGGAYIRATNQSFGLEEITSRIRQTQQTVFMSTVFDRYNELYRYPLAIALVLIIAEFFVLGRKNRLIARFGFLSVPDKQR